ncbi:hypothetical protein DVDV_2803 [Desulfovibrio sp. DV]|nr:hypothetical protein DVDV_2803 [Desulfovibrio sp. DV]
MHVLGVATADRSWGGRVGRRAELHGVYPVSRKFKKQGWYFLSHRKSRIRYET